MPGYAYHSKKFDKSNTYELARAAYSTANYLKDVINTEYKDYTLDIQPAGFNTAGTIWDFVGDVGPVFPGITQGVTSEERTGDSVKLQRLAFRGMIIKHSSATVTICRVILFKGKSEDGVPYQITDILETSDVFSHKSDPRRYDTTILYDEVFVLDSVKSQYVEFDWDRELNWHTQFLPGLPKVANEGLYLLVLSSEPTNAPILRGMARLSYTDS